jgi:hypothetical protein
VSEQTRGHSDETEMIWWPYLRYELTGKPSPQQIKEKIDQLGESEAEYVVRHAGGVIHITESSNFKFGAHSRSFKPEATLVATPAVEGFKYRIIIKSRTSSILFLALVVLGIIAGIAFSRRNDLLIGHYKDTAIVCICVLMMGYFLPVVTFNADIKRLKLFIDDLLDVEP